MTNILSEALFILQSPWERQYLKLSCYFYFKINEFPFISCEKFLMVVGKLKKAERVGKMD